MIEEGAYRPAAAGDPFLDHVLVAQPAAGQGITFKLDSGFQWRLVSIRSLLSTSAAVANRYPFLRVQDPEGNVWYETTTHPAVVAGAANVAVDFNREESSGGTDGAAQVGAGVPGIWIPGGWQLGLGAFGLDVADQFGAFRLLVFKANSY